MNRCVAMVTAFCVTLFALPLISAQDVEKKDAKDVEKKDLEKKDDEKKDAAKKDDAKKDEAKKEEPKKDAKDEPKKKEDGKDEPKKEEPKTTKSKGAEEPKLVHGAVLQGVKLKAVDSAESRSFTVEVRAPDPLKMMQNQQWQMQRMLQMQQNRISNPQQYMVDMRNYQIELMQRQAQAFSMKDVRLQAGDGCKIRVMQPGAEYDDKGNLKKWTKKELEALKGNSKLPGYPAEFDALRQGQYLAVYLAAPKAPEKKAGSGLPGKKKMPDDEEMALPADRQDAVMIVIVADPGNK